MIPSSPQSNPLPDQNKAQAPGVVTPQTDAQKKADADKAAAQNQKS